MEEVHVYTETFASVCGARQLGLDIDESYIKMRHNSWTWPERYMPIQLGDITAKIIVYEEDLRSVQHRDKLCLIKPQTSIFF